MPTTIARQLAPAPLRRIAEPDAPPTQTKPQRRNSDGWFTRAKRRVMLALAGDDEELLVVNQTAVSWHVYHKFHLLGILDPWETYTFRLRKTGNLNARPHQESSAVEYLVLDLNRHVERVEIYRRQLGQEVEVYEMRAA